MRTLISLAALAIGVVPGCGPSPDAPCDVTGVVTFGGKSVADGAVYFVAPDSEAVHGFGKISGGRYRAQVRPGAARVRITADRLIPDQKNEAGNPSIEQYIPARFNEATELKATITRSQRLDWRLAGDGEET